MLDATSAPRLRGFTFSPDWGLLTNGPFALKLLAWLELAAIPYWPVMENTSGKGPLGKSPWAEIDGRLIGGSEFIIEELNRRHGIDLDEDLTPEQRTIRLAWPRTFEGHFHQVTECHDISWLVFFRSGGAPEVRLPSSKHQARR